jgi:hypothetical protein
MSTYVASPTWECYIRLSLLFSHYSLFSILSVINILIGYIQEMSQSTLIPVPQWDPIKILSIEQKKDGHFTCSGVKKNSTTRCGWHLNSQATSDINDLVEQISMRPPQSAIQSFKLLADASLCHNHKAQEMVVVRAWTSAIDHLPPTQVVSSMAWTQASTPSSTPSSQAMLTPTSTSSPSSSQYESNTFHKDIRPHIRAQQRDDGTPTSKSSDGASKDEVRLLRDEIAALTARIAALETNPSLLSRLRKRG